MNRRVANFDWNQVRAFLLAAETGTLSAAAKALGVSQPTVGRQVAALEATLGVALFQRDGLRLSLTQTGLDLLEHARAMGEAALELSLAASGRSEAIEGQVVITASDVLSAYLLPPMLEELRRAAPGIEIEIVASNAIRDLRRREADIAVRHVRPEQPDLIARSLGDSTAHLYAARRYLERHGRPTCAADFAEATFIAMDASGRMAHGLRARGLPVTPANFAFASENGLVAWELVRQGLGIGVMAREVAELSPEVEQLLPEFEPFAVPMWLVTHRELLTSRRIRTVFDHLAAAFEERRKGRPPRGAAGAD